MAAKRGCSSIDRTCTPQRATPGASAARNTSTTAFGIIATSAVEPMTDTDLVNALRDCYDPVQRRSIVELGLVQRATVELDREAPGANVRGLPPRYIARITLRAPSSDDGVNAQLRAQIENRLAGLPEISLVNVNMLPALFPILSTPRS